MKKKRLNFKKCTLLIIFGFLFTQGSLAQFTPGAGGSIPLFTTPSAIPNKIPGFRIEKSHQENNAFWTGTRPVVEMNFPLPAEFEATSYTLQYSTNDGQNWANFKYNGSQDDLTTTGDNFSLNLDQNYKLRLLVNGGPKNGYTSNEVFVALSGVPTRFAGWSIDQGMFISGTMSPFIGCGIDVSFTVRKLSDDSPVTGFLTYQWYRVNPASYEMTAIPGATNLRYITTPDDAGYMLSIRANSDGVNVGGFCQLMVMTRNIFPNKAFLTDINSNGFTINLFKTVSNFTSNDFVISDKDNHEVPVTTLTQGANAAIYNVSTTLDPSENPFMIRSTSPSWSMVTSFMEDHMIMEGLVLDLTTGIRNADGKLNLYPLPARNQLNFSNVETIKEASVLNLCGQILSSQLLNSSQGAISTAQLGNGIYVLKLTSTDGCTYVQKFQISK